MSDCDVELVYDGAERDWLRLGESQAWTIIPGRAGPEHVAPMAVASALLGIGFELRRLADARDGGGVVPEWLPGPSPDDPRWEGWFALHPDHRLVGKMVGHPAGCDRRCLDDAPRAYGEYHGFGDPCATADGWTQGCVCGWRVEAASEFACMKALAGHLIDAISALLGAAD